MKNILLIQTLPFLLPLALISQKTKTYQVRTIAFYNVENLFDTINDPNTYDDDRTPLGKDKWTKKHYEEKIRKIARVLSEIGYDKAHTSPDVIGIAEIENREVLTDLINDPYLIDKNYGIIHFDSPDLRGVDVAFLYKKDIFVPMSFKNYELVLYDEDGYRDFTRDQLLISGFFDNEEMHFIVNHWPSRRGGEEKSRPKREAAARLNKKITDSLIKINPKAKIISMGDLNDDPVDSSLKKILKTESNIDSVTAGSIYNPMEKMTRKGLGSLAYHDNWNLFDQIFFTGELLNEEKSSYKFWKAGIFNKDYLILHKGKYKGYPYRTYAGGQYAGGYSDHFPVYIYLIKEVE
ncbi:endonuclease/exonuclease/phosphatase family protein [Abyssalbus ytuae]|uniref:Endonuclease/exonuclease/phosphatase family protein n=1 Tax=Abyssalbus ytuae TaxID=2926907 RepID=A0A9E7A3D2_9FLAO|nr:endonuclease/exonuclease/phosphatase family protein [Abyssalbus ytuae]UOB19131.1 endonuclease/exonuclease/phosphatase family protein [Abyssalbus ytuae]